MVSFSYTSYIAKAVPNRCQAPFFIREKIEIPCGT
jgi:hypothetical protein